MLNDEFFDHLDISFALAKNDWYKPETAGRFEHHHFPAR